MKNIKPILTYFVIALVAGIWLFFPDHIPDWFFILLLLIAVVGFAGTAVLLVWNLAKERWLVSLLSIALSIMLVVQYYFVYWYLILWARSG